MPRPPAAPAAASEASTESTSRGAIQVIDRLVGLLDALAEHPEAVSLKALSQRTGLHPSTAHRILNDLVTARIVAVPYTHLTLPTILRV